MIVPHVEVKTGSVLEIFKIQYYVLDVWDWIRSVLNPFVEFSEVRDEAYRSVFLRDEKGRGCPL